MHVRNHRVAGVLTLLLLPSLWLAACTEYERSDIYTSTWNVEEPVQLQRHIAFLNRTLEEVMLVEADGAKLCFSHLPVGRQPSGLVVSPDQRHLAVVSRKDQALTVITLGEELQTRVYPLGSPFAGVEFSPDSRYVVAFYVPGTEPASGILYNPNAYAVVDLERAPSDADAVLERALRGLGSTPSRVHFVPPFRLTDDGPEERYAMFVFDAYVTFADLQDPSFEVTVFLTLGSATANIKPSKILFTTSAMQPSLQNTFVYMLASNSDDVFAINLLPGRVEDGKVRLRPDINQLPSGRTPVDMALFIGPDGREKMLTVNQSSSDIALIDASTASVVRVPLTAKANRIHLYDAVNPSSGAVESHALLYGEGMGQQVVSFVRLMELEDRRSQAVDSLSVNAAVAQVFPSPIDGQVVVRHQGSGGLSLLNLGNKTYNPLQARAALSDLSVDAAGLRIFAAVENSHFLNIIDLVQGTAMNVPLDFNIKRVFWLPSAGSLLISHMGNAGLMTAFAVPHNEGAGAFPISRENASIYTGFLLHEAAEVTQ